MKTFYALIFTFSILIFDRSASHWPSQDECGKLNVKNFLSPTGTTELSEYPWVARVAAEDGNRISYIVLAVLISKRYLLSPAHGYEFVRWKVDHVLLGDWDAKNKPDEIDCNELDQCAPQPKKYRVEEIVVHPDYKRFKNDIALLRLTTDVIFNEYISPICMPPRETDAYDYTSQFLPVVGFLMRSEETRRMKALMYIVGTRSCDKYLSVYELLPENDKNICGILDRKYSVMTGSPLMDVRVVDGDPQSLYMRGMITAGSTTRHKFEFAIFLRISSYRDWIEYNVIP